MAQFKKIGGKLDVIHIDAEWSGWLIARGFAQQRSSTTNRTGVWGAIVADDRWPALQTRLNAAGKSVHVTFHSIPSGLSSRGGP